MEPAPAAVVQKARMPSVLAPPPVPLAQPVQEATSFRHVGRGLLAAAQRVRIVRMHQATRVPPRALPVFCHVLLLKDVLQGSMHGWQMRSRLQHVPCVRQAPSPLGSGFWTQWSGVEHIRFPQRKRGRTAAARRSIQTQKAGGVLRPQGQASGSSWTWEALLC